ncbi:MAG: phosphatidylglycerophosphatase A [Planctomycetota bacterium]|nr:phosphatidylglycerophosphatase A [Planctomycetota bacterium]
MNWLRKLLVSGFGTGYLPVAPGSWGSAAVAAGWLGLCWGSGGDERTLTIAMAAVIVVFSAVCVGFGRFAEKAYARKDPSQMVADEWAGQAVTMLALPVGAGMWQHAVTAGVGLFFFRLFDVIKPPPARQFEALPAGWGMLLDDLMAGVYANLVCQVVLRVGVFR